MKEDYVGYFTFIYQFSDEHPRIEIRMPRESNIREIFDGFKKFLEASGFIVGNITEVNVEEDKES